MVLSLQEIVFIHYSLFFSVLSVEDWICFFKDWILIRKKKYMYPKSGIGIFILAVECL